MEKIDFVVTWLDPSDPEWQKEYRLYKGETGTTDGALAARFRDWELFRYWFRSIENYAPWVNKVFLVTNGKFPDWINSNNPKLVLVKHSDYIPKEYLPTFNSHTIELNMHRIEGLSEHFVYFNDDCFLNAPVSPSYYFRDGLPCDLNDEEIFNAPVYHESDHFGISMIKRVNIAVLNSQFRRSDAVSSDKRKWFGWHLGTKNILSSLIISVASKGRFVGFHDRHFEQPFLKSTFEAAWKDVPTMLQKSCTRFRENINLSPYFFRYWQFATNQFYPVKLNHYKYYMILPEKMEQISNTLRNKDIWSICLNDSARITDDDFNRFKAVLHQEFNKKFPQKSSFEI